MAKNHCRRDLQTEGWTHQQKTSLTKLGNKKLSSSATPSCIISQCLVSSCIILDFQTENTIREFDTWDGHHCRTPWCCKLHASHRSRRKHPQRYNEPNSSVTSTTSCTNLLHTRTIQCKECVLRTLRPRLLRLTSKHHCRIDMQTEQWSSLWTYQFPHRLPHQTNQAPHVLARIHLQAFSPSISNSSMSCGKSTHKSFYTQTLLHMVLLHKHTLTHRRFDTQKPLHTNAFTHRRFYTQTLLHTIDQVKSHFFLSFWRPTSISCVRVAIE